MIRLYLFVLGLVLSSSAQGQSIKSLDFAKDYQKQGVKTRVCVEYRYKGYQITDSMAISEARFDDLGRIIHYTEYFAGGRKLNEQTFSYDAQGKLIASTVAHVFNNWEPVELQLEFDAKGKLIARKCPVEIRNFWTEERYSYNNQGKLTRTEQFSSTNGHVALRSSMDYAASLHTGENTPMDIHNEHGLHDLHQFFNANGQVEYVWKYRYQ
jgi:YD repeat-containing protein